MCFDSRTLSFASSALLWAGALSLTSWGACFDYAVLVCIAGYGGVYDMGALRCVDTDEMSGVFWLPCITTPQTSDASSWWDLALVLVYTRFSFVCVMMGSHDCGDFEAAGLGMFAWCEFLYSGMIVTGSADGGRMPTAFGKCIKSIDCEDYLNGNEISWRHSTFSCVCASTSLQFSTFRWTREKVQRNRHSLMLSRTRRD
jgi:hypothetical protein